MSNNIALGPLLGTESENLYTFCILINGDLNVAPVLQINEIQVKPKYSSDKIGYKKEYIFYRYEVEINKTNTSQQIKYQFLINGEKLSNCHRDNWSFKISSQDSSPTFAFVSCNGDHDLYPTSIKPERFLGWKKMNEVSPDYIFFTGDQVYSDSIWERVPEFKDFIMNLVNEKSSENKEFDIGSIDDFYIQLYIDSWANEYLALALAQIPNVMTWDDHDIIDGYGSYQEDIQEVLKKIIFKYAKKYYELFQLRTIHNTTLLDRRIDLSSILILKDHLFVLPDTRSNRSMDTVLNHSQYSTLAKNIIENMNEISMLTFIIPVPIAHRDFTNIVEKGAKFIYDKFVSFIKESSDDLIDHWDHTFHQAEQKVILDFIFEMGEILTPEVLLIVSGDVHASGISKITKHLKYNEHRYATQIISSPIVNDPASGLDKFKNFLTEDFKVVDCYSCNLKNFGNYPKKDIYNRNFIVVNSETKNARLYMEDKKYGWIDSFDDSFGILKTEKGKDMFRKLNNFKAK